MGGVYKGFRFGFYLGKGGAVQAVRRDGVGAVKEVAVATMSSGVSLRLRASP